MLPSAACSGSSDGNDGTSAASPTTGPMADSPTTGPMVAPTTTAAAMLDKVTFTLADFEGYVPAGAQYLGLSFDRGHLAASVGCNILAAPYQIDGDQLTWTSPPVGELSCPPGLTADEERLLSFLSDGMTATVEAGRLTLAADDASFTFSQSGPAPLVNTEWRLHATIVDGTALSAPAGNLPMFTIVEGTARFNTECDNGIADVTLTEAQISFTDVTWEGLTCTKEATLGAAVNEDFKSLLQRVTDGDAEYVLGAETLIVRNGDDGVVFRRTP